MAYPKLIDEFRRTKVHNWLQNEKQVKGIEGLRNLTDVQMVGQKVVLDTTPVLAGVEYPGYSEVIGKFFKSDGQSPAIEWRWGYFDAAKGLFVMCWNSQDRNDPWNLGSYGKVRDGLVNSCNPAFHLEEQIASGSFEVHAWPYLDGEWNGGLTVDGRPNPAVWKAD